MKIKKDLTRQIKKCLPEEEWKKKAHTTSQQWAWKAESLKNNHSKQKQQQHTKPNNQNNHSNNNSKHRHWNTQDQPMKHNSKEKTTAPKWKYNQLITLATLNVRGLKEITKREQIITHMIEHRNIYIYIYIYTLFTRS